MPLEYLVYLNIILLTRLVYLLRDGAMSWAGNVLLTVVQCGACLVVFQWSSPLAAMLVSVAIFTGCGWFIEKRLSSSAFWRIASLLGLVLLPGIFFHSKHAGLRDWISDGSVLLGYLPILQSSLFSVGSAVFLFVLLLTANETNILMRVVLHYCNLEPHIGQTSKIDEDEFKAGRLIGVLERWLIIFIILSTDDMSAIGFIIAAKGLVRLKKLQDENFAEYVLVGTLLSALAAVLAAKWALLIEPV